MTIGLFRRIKNGKKRNLLNKTKHPIQPGHLDAELSRKVLLAGVGAAVLAQDEISDFVDRLVERGEIAEQDARNLSKMCWISRKKSSTPFAPNNLKNMHGMPPDQILKN
jgi:hypothetical protein